MTKLRLLVLLPWVFLLGCGGGKGRLDWLTRGVLAGATKVEAFRIDAKNGPETSPEDRRRVEGERRIGYWLITAQGRDQGKEFADKLAGILLDDKNYSDTFADCFEPGVAFRVWKGQESVDVVICFHCDNIYCGPPKPVEMENASLWDSPARARLVRLAKEAFPDDKDIQALEEK